MLRLLLKPFHWLLSLCLGVIAFVLLALALAGFYVPFLAEKWITYKTTFPVEISNSHINAFLGEVQLWDANIENPARFHEPHLVVINELSAHISPLAALSEPYHIKRLVIDIAEATWVKTANGEINIDAFMEGLEPAHSHEKPLHKAGSSSRKVPSKNAKVHIDTLILRIGTINRVDYTGGTAKASQYKANIDIELYDVAGVADIMGPLTSALIKFGLTFFSDALIQGLPLDIQQATGLIPTSPGKAAQLGQEVLDGAKRTINSIF